MKDTLYSPSPYDPTTSVIADAVLFAMCHSLWNTFIHSKNFLPSQWLIYKEDAMVGLVCFILSPLYAWTEIQLNECGLFWLFPREILHHWNPHIGNICLGFGGLMDFPGVFLCLLSLAFWPSCWWFCPLYLHLHAVIRWSKMSRLPHFFLCHSFFVFSSIQNLGSILLLGNSSSVTNTARWAMEMVCMPGLTSEYWHLQQWHWSSAKQSHHQDHPTHSTYVKGSDDNDV